MNALVLRPVLEDGPALAAAHPEPTLVAILSTVASAYGLSEGEVRLRQDELAAGARDEFLWLCEQLKTASPLACASYIGLPVSDALGAITNVERQRGSDAVLRARLEEACLTLHCEAIALARLDLVPSETSRPVDIARRVMASRRHAGLASIEDIQSLGAAYLARQTEAESAAQEIAILRAELSAAKAEASRAPVAARHPLDAPLREFLTTAAEVDSASGPYERSARARHEKASLALRVAGESHFNIHEDI